ncbi:kinase-like domain-containing protein [Thamnidium elegans]|nr:kinase-like domain-containing protein [Thamnidium elegans]
MPQSLHNSLSFLKSANQSSSSLERSPSSSRSRSGSILRAISLHPSSTPNQTPMTPLSRTSTNNSTRFNFEEAEAGFSSNPEDFEIKNPIGYGSSAVVYKAIYKPRNIRVAIKMIDLDLFERNQIDELRRETALMALSKHPNVLKVYGSFVSGSKLYIATPYLSGGSCLDIMKNGFKDGFEESVIATILKQALEGLIYLHKNNHIHRDVKAGNLLMDDQGTVLLADFGVSSSLTENNEVRKTFVGTPCWMAPEVMEQSGYDFKADIWSFGITAIELATGHAPFAKLSPMKVLMMTLNQSPPTLNRDQTKYKYTRTFKEMIDTCLCKDPSKRPAAEKLLLHPFFKQAKKKDYLIKTVLACVPSLDQRPHKKLGFKQVTIENTDQWDFDTAPDDDKLTTAPIQKQHISFLTTKNNMTDLPSPISSEPDVPITSTKKSRFVIEETNDITVSSQRSLSPNNLSSSPNNNNSILSADSSSNTWQSSMGLGLGISSSSSPTIAATLQDNNNPVKKGRFSLNQQSTLPPAIRTSNMPAVVDSPQLEAIPMSRITSNDSMRDRKSRFEVQHLSTPIDTAPPPAPMSNSSHEIHQPLFQHRRSLSRDSVGKVSRFSIEKDDGQDLVHPFETTRSASPEYRKKGRFELTGGMTTAERLESPQTTLNSTSNQASIAASMASSSRSMHQRSLSSSDQQQQQTLVYHHMETLLKQTETQKNMLQDLMYSLNTLSNGGLPHNIPRNSIDIRKMSNSSSEYANTSIQFADPKPTTIQNKITSTMDHLQQLLTTSSRDKERLLKENEALKKEIERLRKLQLSPSILKPSTASVSFHIADSMPTHDPL